MYARARHWVHRCEARTRRGTPCQAEGRGRGGRFGLHGGASSGPTAEGPSRSARRRVIGSVLVASDRLRLRVSPRLGMLKKVRFADLHAGGGRRRTRVSLSPMVGDAPPRSLHRPLLVRWCVAGASLDISKTFAKSPPMVNVSDMARERTQQSPSTLGDVLYAKSKAPVLEQEWVTLVQSIAAGDQLALHALYERAHGPVFTLIMRITANRETAEELTVDVFHNVWQRASRYDAANGTVLGWIMNQARSRAIDRLRFEIGRSAATAAMNSRRPRRVPIHAICSSCASRPSHCARHWRRSHRTSARRSKPRSSPGLRMLKPRRVSISRSAPSRPAFVRDCTSCGTR